MKNCTPKAEKSKKISRLFCAWLAGALLAGFLPASPLMASVIVYSQDLPGFNAAAGNPPIAIDFDGITPDTDITNNTIAGVKLEGPGSPLLVVKGTDTYTTFWGGPPGCKLFPTSGENVLSPGGKVLGPGPNSSIEFDDLTLIFTAPVSAFGFDYLSQSADGASYADIEVYNASNVLLYSGNLPITNNGLAGPGGADFWGIVSTSADIAKIVINEQDDDATYPDCNVGYDTFRFQPVPLPATFWLVGAGLLGLGGFSLRRRRS
jgi:hypothetical protein